MNLVQGPADIKKPQAKYSPQSRCSLAPTDAITHGCSRHEEFFHLQSALLLVLQLSFVELAAALARSSSSSSPPGRPMPFALLLVHFFAICLRCVLQPSKAPILSSQVSSYSLSLFLRPLSPAAQGTCDST